MSKHETILGHLVGWGLSRRYEDAATEGVAYLLRTYPQLRRHFVDLLRSAQPALPGDLHFGTQDATDEGRPDMAGSSDGVTRVLVENKFWAALTGNQPVSYLQRLQEPGHPGLLLFIVPRPRAPWIWRELLARLQAAPMTWTELADRGPLLVENPLELGAVRLAMTTWDALLMTLRGGVTDQPRALADLEQLAGVCSAADADATRPLIREELSDPQVPTRILQYGTIVQDAVARGCKDILKVEGLRPTHTWTTIGRYFQFVGENGPGGWLGVDLELWRQYEVGPLWLTFGPGQWGQAGRVRETLGGWVRQTGRILHDQPNDGVSLHVDLPAGREHDAVVDAVVAQLREVRRLLLARPALFGE